MLKGHVIIISAMILIKHLQGTPQRKQLVSRIDIFVECFSIFSIFSHFVLSTITKNYNVSFIAIKDTPTVLSISTTSVTLEFLPSNGSSSRYYVQYKLHHIVDDSAYTTGVFVTDDDRSAPRTYSVVQGSLTPDTEYSFRILPTVKVGKNYQHVPAFQSPLVTTRTRPVGKFMISFPIIQKNVIFLIKGTHHEQQ